MICNLDLYLVKGVKKRKLPLFQLLIFLASRGNPVFMAALDANKAFDRVIFFALFTKLICIGVSAHLLKILMNWHLKLCGCVLWCDRLSSSSYVISGVRQDGINSPWFFNLYINDLIVKLRNSGYGYYIFVDFLGCLFFADDIFVLVWFYYSSAAYVEQMC